MTDDKLAEAARVNEAAIEWVFRSLVPTTGVWGPEWSVFTCGGDCEVGAWDTNHTLLVEKKPASPGHGGLTCFSCGSTWLRQSGRYGAYVVD